MMAGVEGALKCLQAFVVDQWKTGGAAELRLFCESGCLKASVSADFGPSCLSWRANSAFMGGNTSGSPSRQRRRERRAAARAAAEKAATEKVVKEKVADEKTAAEEVAAEKCAALKAVTENCDAKKAAEKCAALKAVTENCDAKKAAEKCAALKAETEKCDAMKAFEKCDAKKAAEKCAAEKAAAAERDLTSASTAAVASTSCLGSQPTTVETCWNCEGYFTPDHQCDGHISGAVTLLPPVAVDSSPRPSPSAPIILKKPVKMLDGSRIWTPKTHK